MSSIELPAEIWSRIFFFVAPPLPHVGLEKESFAEDAKGWRGDDLVKGRWKGIDALMLVSKRINVSWRLATFSLILFRVSRVVSRCVIS